ncbi:SCO family protein [soil metagenome]
MRSIIVFFISVLCITACSSNLENTVQNSAAAKRYTLRGKVISVDREKKRAKVDHGPIEGFMEAMTMDFPIHADWVWNDLKPGSEIRAELVVDSTADEPFWLENIGIIAAAIPGQEPTANESAASIGKELPDFTLTNQDGKRISPKDFRGKALAITFIYARCPLPEYCIKMSANFSDLANQLNADPERREKIRLLSISFDPENDTPEKLRSYGLGYLGKNAKPDFGVWQLAVGQDKEVRKIADFFGLRYEVDPADKTQFNHSLRTVVITPGGKVAKVISGNEWTPGELLKELESTL